MAHSDKRPLIPPATAATASSPRPTAPLPLTVLEQALAAIAQFQIEGPTGRWQCEYCSPGCATLLGYPPEQLMQEPELWRSGVLPADWQTLFPVACRHLSTTGTWTGELRFMHSSGQPRWLQVNCRAVPLVADGRAAPVPLPPAAAADNRPSLPPNDNAVTAWCVTLVATEVTALKQIQDIERDSQHQFRQVVENSPNAIFSVNRTGQLLTWNQSCQHFFGYNTAICGQSLWMLLPAEQHPAIAQHLAAVFRGESITHLEMTYRCLDGNLRRTLSRIYPITDLQGQITTCVFANTDITQRDRAEHQLRQREFLLRRAQQLAQIGDWALDVATQSITGSEESARLLNIDLDRTVPLPLAAMLRNIHPEDRERVRSTLEAGMRGAAPFNLEVRVLRDQAPILRYIALTGQMEPEGRGDRTYLFGTVQDITLRKQSELLQQYQARRNQLMLHLTQRVRQSLEINEILNTTVVEVRQLLQADRVTIYRFAPDWSGTFTVEAVRTPDLSILGQTHDDPCFREKYIASYCQGRICAIEDVNTAAIADCHRLLLQQFGVRANLVVPIMHSDRLWGLLIVHECRAPRPWQPWEQELLQQLSVQVGIALQQSEIYEWAQTLNAELERKVQHRTERLERSASFETLLKGITDKVRDTLDEQTILKQVVQELSTELQVSICDTGVYDLAHNISTIQQEHITDRAVPASQQVVNMQDFADIYPQLLAGQTLHFCWLIPDSPDHNKVRRIDQKYSILACPMIDDQGVMGDLWLYRAGAESFDALEIRLVEQIANQCAIAIRQARLYEAAQAQVHELERLNRIKDEFLSSVSHELRTPMANIKMATQMLEVNLSQRDKAGRNADYSFDRYFQILKDECHRELKLINDLLDLSRLDADTEPLLPSTMNLRDWLEHLIEPYAVRIRQQAQTFVCDLPATLPTLNCDFTYLGRIVGELLNNACKYTPSGETITLHVREGQDHVLIQIRNSGVEIPAAEQHRVFERFYRIPSNDPWRHEGTGLGLALVQKLAERLGSIIRLESGDNWTSFSVYLFPALLAERMHATEDSPPPAAEAAEGDR